jgi:hypothetical protein
MNKLSLEESLKILSPSESTGSIKKSPRRAKRRVKTPSRSPVRIPKISPTKKYSADEKIISIENGKSLYDEALEELEKEQLEINQKEKKIEPHTPTRFTIETPRTPTAKFDKIASDTIDLAEELKNYRYSIIKYLIDQDTNSIKYVICFDPNGQIIFVHLDKKASTNSRGHKNIYINPQEDIPKLGSYQNGLMEKLTADMRGLLFYDQGGYLFALRDDTGEYEISYYLLENQEVSDMLKLTQTYLVVSLGELEKAPTYMVQNSKKNYQIIQQQQLLSNKETFNHLLNTMDSLNKQMKNFDKTYKKYANNLVDDWSLLGSFAKDYYNNYSKGKLSMNDKDKFDKVSLNMYARFQNFNEHVFMVQDLLPLCAEINKIRVSLAEKEDIIKNKDKTYSGRIIDIKDINNMI